MQATLLTLMQYATTIKTLSTLPAVIYAVDVARTVDYTVEVGLDINGSMCHFNRYQLPWSLTMERIKSDQVMFQL